MRKLLSGLILFLTIGFFATQPVGATTTSTVSPPSTIAANCSKNVAYAMQHWLMSLPANTTVVAPAGACYLINTGITLSAVQGLTIAGGTWEDMTAPVSGASPVDMDAVIWLQGGSNLTFENMTIEGSNPGGYNPAGAFGAGIRSDGVIGLHVTNVNITNVWGDGLELAPLRGPGADMGSTIVNPSENVFVYGLTINGAGRQGITLASVTNATLTGLTLKHIGLDFFDAEADQWNEGAQNVTINGCETGGVGGLFFANAGLSAGSNYTGNITVENCTMDQATAGEAILVETPTLETHPRGPITFVHDTILCGSSVYVSCVQSTDANITVASSNVVVPAGTIHEPVYRAIQSTGLTFSGDTVSGYGSAGTTDTSSHVSILGGVWAPYAPPPVRTPTTTTTTTKPKVTTPTTTKPGSSLSHASALGAVSASGSSGPGDPNGPGASGGPGGPTTATVLSSERANPLASAGVHTVIALDLVGGFVAYGVLLLRRRRRQLLVPAMASVEDLLGPSGHGGAF